MMLKIIVNSDQMVVNYARSFFSSFVCALIFLSLLTHASIRTTNANNYNRNKYTKENSRLIRPFVRFATDVTIHSNLNFSHCFSDGATHIIYHEISHRPTVKLKKSLLSGNRFFSSLKRKCKIFKKNIYLYRIPLCNKSERKKSQRKVFLANLLHLNNFLFKIEINIKNLFFYANL